MINASSWRLLTTAALCLPLSLSLAACGGDDSGETDAGTTSDAGTTAGGSTTTGADDDDDDDDATTGGTTAGPGTTTDDPSTSSTTEEPTTDDPSTTGEPLMVNAFRWDSMRIEDPGFFAIGCNVPITDTVNDMLNDGVTMDMSDPPDGSLDLNFVMLFPDPLDQGGAGGDMDLALANTCLVPLEAPICSLDGGQTSPTTFTNDGSACLAPEADHLNYDLGTDPVPGPCFTSGVIPDLPLTIGDFALPLQDVEISGTYDGDPADGVVNGIMRGFLSQEDGENTTIPEDVDFVGGMSIADLVCKPADMDDNGGVPGWWFYVTFTANTATWNG